MIKGAFTRNQAGVIVSFELSGHAQSGEYGHDIVCAAVSALAISAVNGLDALAGYEPIVDVDEDEGGYLYVEILSGLTQEQVNISQILLENLLLGLQAIEAENEQAIQLQTNL
ncbi:ribosomal-processing cysteine protease Prp [Enterococcus sp. AZ103]|uniref:ribosomal-processing cysteine protease Prp n=1 Tax=Enterococcus sp. AZ103 TaxID=2774628 RepID=UPI003F242BC6